MSNPTTPTPIPDRFTSLVHPKPNLKTGAQILVDHRRISVVKALLDVVSVKP